MKTNKWIQSYSMTYCVFSFKYNARNVQVTIIMYRNIDYLKKKWPILYGFTNILKGINTSPNDNYILVQLSRTINSYDPQRQRMETSSIKIHIIQVSYLLCIYFSIAHTKFRVHCYNVISFLTTFKLQSIKYQDSNFMNAQVKKFTIKPQLFPFQYSSNVEKCDTDDYIWNPHCNLPEYRPRLPRR